jgi:ferrous iron transport protein A
MCMNEATQTTLADLKPGESAIVAVVGGVDALHRRLLDMGLTPGVKVLLQKTAPMGDPLEIHLRGYALTLRVEDARNIGIREKSVIGKGEKQA